MLGFALRGESHQFVFARVNFEAGEISERGVKQSERVRKTELGQHLNAIAASDAVTRRRPFADAVDREKRCFREWRGKKCRGCV